MLSRSETNNEYEVLLKKYVEIFNRAIEANQDKFPYKEMWQKALCHTGNSHDLHYVVYDMRPKASFRLRMADGKLVMIDKDKNTDQKEFCSLSYEYLKKVAENSDEYIRNPEKLNWQWLK